MGDPKFVFEELRPEDAEKCAEALLKALKGRLPPALSTKEGLIRMIAGPRSLSVVSKRDGKIVGIITGSTSMPPSIMFLYVLDKEAAMAGVNGKLVDHFMEAVKRRIPKAEFVTTTIATEDRGFISFYLSKGFTICGFIKGGFYGRDVVVLRRELK